MYPFDTHHHPISMQLPEHIMINRVNTTQTTASLQPALFPRILHSIAWPSIYTNYTPA